MRTHFLLYFPFLHGYEKACEHTLNIPMGENSLNPILRQLIGRTEC